MSRQGFETDCEVNGMTVNCNFMSNRYKIIPDGKSMESNNTIFNWQNILRIMNCLTFTVKFNI